jgi:hypothetical protein
LADLAGDLGLGKRIHRRADVLKDLRHAHRLRDQINRGLEVGASTLARAPVR